MSQRRDRTSPTCPDGPITQATVGPVVHISGVAQEAQSDLSTLARGGIMEDIAWCTYVTMVHIPIIPKFL